MEKEEVLKFIQETVKAELAGFQTDIEGLLQPVVDKMTESLTTFVTDTVKPLEDRFTALETNKPAEKDPNSPSDPLEDRLKMLEEQLTQERSLRETKEQETNRMRFQSALSKELDQYSPQQRAIVAELLETRYAGQAKEKKGEFYLDGKTLGETVKGFFESDNGKYFLPSNYQEGNATPNPEAPKAPSSEPSLTEMISAVF